MTAICVLLCTFVNLVTDRNAHNLCTHNGKIMDKEL